MKKVNVFMGLAAVCCFGVPTSALANLIVNGDFEAGNSGFSTDFAHAPTDITGAQTYAIVSDPSLVHGRAVSYGDHTSGAGNMMAVNGTQSTNDTLVWGQSVSVAAQTDYDFSLWTSTWFSQAGLQVRINDTPLGTSFATPGPEGIWEQTTRHWSSGQATTAEIEIVNTTASFVGNDFAIDDIRFVADVPFVLGDMNGSGELTNGDIAPFVQALTAPGDYAAAYPGLDPDLRGDFTSDGQLTNGDIAGFVAALTGGGASAVPEPASLAMLVAGGLVFLSRRTRASATRQAAGGRGGA